MCMFTYTLLYHFLKNIFYKIAIYMEVHRCPYFSAHLTTIPKEQIYLLLTYVDSICFYMSVFYKWVGGWVANIFSCYQSLVGDTARLNSCNYITMNVEIV